MVNDNQSMTKEFINSRILFKPLFGFSVAMFILSLIMLPFSIKWTTFCIFAIIGVWTMIPGFISSFLSRLVMTDVFTYILALHYGVGIAIVYVILTAGLWIYFGPKIPPMIIMRDGVALIMSALAVSIMPYFKTHLVEGYILFMVVGYSTYYALVVMLSTNEIPRELARAPTNTYFDFFFTSGLLKVIEGPINNLLLGNMYAVLPLMLVVGVIIGAIKLVQKIFFDKKIEKKEEEETRYASGYCLV